MLKILNSNSIKFRKDRVGIGRAGYDKSEINRSGIDNIEVDGGEFGEVDGGEVGNDEVGKKGQKMFKSKNLSKFKKMVESAFFTPRARLACTKLRQAFFKAPILHHFDLKRYIRIERDILDYAISRIFS